MSANVPVEGTCSSCGEAFGGNFVGVAVTDGGGGIDPDVLPKVFEPFFTTKSVGAGTGMGLAVVHGVVHDHGGHIYLASSPSGTRLDLLLPGAMQHAIRPPGPTLTPSEATADFAHSAPARVLVVDDELSVRVFLETLLTHWGYIVECASDGEEARARLASSDSAFDVAIVDQTMPNLLGTQLLAWAKEAGLSTPMILCTGYSDDLDEAQALAHGAASMLRKPVETGLLRSLLNRYAPRVDDSARQSR